MEKRKRNDPDANDPEARLALVLLRNLRLLEQREIAHRIRMAPSQLSDYERGEREVPQDVLEKVAAAVDFPVDLLDPMLHGIRSLWAAAKGKARPSHAVADSLSTELHALMREAADVVLEPLFTVPERMAPSPDELWAHLEGCSARERRLLVEELEEYWHPELSARVAAESVKLAPTQPQESLELGELARLIVERAGAKGERLDAEGRAESPDGAFARVPVVQLSR